MNKFKQLFLFSQLLKNIYYKEIFSLTSYGHSIPHPTKVHKGGEDFFVFNSSLVAVADGVGGWIEQGVDP
jgi:hypothetical protein